MWFLIACGGAAVVCAASWWRAGRTRPLGNWTHEMGDAHTEALARSTIDRNFGTGMHGGGGGV